MSQNNDLKLPAVDDAIGMLDGLYADVFFNKMAEYGLVPQTQEGMVSMLETAAYLDMVDQGSTKSASEDPFVQANAALKEVLAHENYIDRSAGEVAGIKQAAFALAQNPDLYKAVLSVKTAQHTQDQ